MEVNTPQDLAYSYVFGKHPLLLSLKPTGSKCFSSGTAFGRGVLGVVETISRSIVGRIRLQERDITRVRGSGRSCS